jgi:hypothetical protein
MRKISIAIGSLLILSLASSAGAAQVAPPGNSGVNQYSETLPGAGGDQPSSDSGGGGAEGNQGSSLSPKAQRALQEHGPTGAAVAGLASQTAPQVANSGAQNRSHDSRESGGGGSALGAGVDQLSGSETSGMGVALPIIILLSLIGAIAVFVLRRRNEQGHTQ